MFKFKNIQRIFSIVFCYSLMVSCTSGNGQQQTSTDHSNPSLVQYENNTIASRFIPPAGYERKNTNGFGKYLRELALMPKGSLVQYYDGSSKDSTGVYCAVVDQKIQNRDLHQCADAVMRQYATYLFQNKKYDDISFTFQSGFKFPFKKWAQGYRVNVSKGGSWYKKTGASYSAQTFQQYLTMVYAYCGTASLEKDLKSVDMKNLQIGDVWIKGGHPGHAVLVVDMATNQSGHKMFLLAQSYMPAQQMQILINPNNGSISPWYSLEDIKSSLETPEWEFSKNQLKRF